MFKPFVSVLLAAAGLAVSASFAQAPSLQFQPSYCAAGSVPCTTTGPAGTGTGDPLWLVGGKTNANQAQLYGFEGGNTPAVAAVAVGGNIVPSGLQNVDGVTGAVGLNVLLTAESNAAQNGPWVEATSTWARPTWYPAGGVTTGYQFPAVQVLQGTVYAGSTWVLGTPSPITVGTTNTTWTISPLAINATTSTGSLPPGGNAGGNLTGTYPNPTIATLPAISGAALTNLAAANLTGTASVNTTGSAGSVPATGVTAGAFPAGVTIPAGQITGSIPATSVPATGVTAGAFGAGVTLPATQLTGTIAAAQEPAFTGDVTKTAGSVATVVAQVNGSAPPVSAAVVGTNSSKQIIAATVTGSGGTIVESVAPALVTPALGIPASGTLTNTTGFPAANLAAGNLPSGVLANDGQTLLDATNTSPVAGKTISPASNTIGPCATGMILGNFSGISAGLTCNPGITVSGTGTTSQVLVGGTTPAFGSLDLSLMVGSSILPVANGGCGINVSPVTSSNTACGINALLSLTTGALYNTAFGFSAGQNLTTDTYTTAFGYQALKGIAGGCCNTGFGYDVMSSGTSNGGGNAGFGGLSLQNCTGSNCNQNTALGWSSASTLTTGANNTIVGQSVASTTLTTGSHNILIGDSSSIDTYFSSTNNELNIQNAIRGGTAALTGSPLACGTSPSLSSGGNDLAGTITTGTGSFASCILTMAIATGNAPTCLVTARSGTPAAYTTADNGTAATLTITTAATSVKYDYFCPRH